jgi:aminoglycoside 2'-N-acetyltransferase I
VRDTFRVTDLRILHTADLRPQELRAIRPLLDEAFEDGISDDDLEHALGGIHVMAWDDAELVGHASVVQRRLLHDRRVLRAGYVEGVGVRPDVRRRGLFAQLMNEIERVTRAAYDVGALSASQMAADLYVRRGWVRWKGTTSVLTPDGLRRTPEEDGSVYVLAGQGGEVCLDPNCLDLNCLDLNGDLACDWRSGDVW